MILKNIFDRSTAFIGLIILCPILICIFLLIRIKMPNGPAIFKQKRIGQYGKPFIMYKFRTMNVEHNGISISVKGESRITPLGAYLRKYKLDELPELWNVLIGNMSLVGPRPDVPGYADKLQGIDKVILNIKPGITGPASIKYANEEELLAQQVNPIDYNNNIIYPDKIKINIIYFNNRSFLLDLKIILCTIFHIKLNNNLFK